jgi:flagellar assembly protein FliH
LSARSAPLRPVAPAPLASSQMPAKTSRSTMPHPNRATGPVPLAKSSAPRAVPLAERLPHAAPGPVMPSWVAQRGPAPKTRALVPDRDSLAVVPVAQSAEESWLEERQREIDEARSEAEHEGLRMGQAKVEMLIERYLDAIKRLGMAAKAARKPNPEEIVDIAFLVAREIVGRELTIDREITARRLDEVLGSVGVDASTVIRLGGADLAYIRKRRPELAAAGVQFVEDASLGPGGCKVETPKAAIDLCIEARLAAVRGEVAAIVAEAAPPEKVAPSTEEEIVLDAEAEEMEIE